MPMFALLLLLVLACAGALFVVRQLRRQPAALPVRVEARRSRR